MPVPRNTNYQRIPVAGLRLEKQDSMSCSGYLLGGLQVGSEKLHFEAIRVDMDGDEQVPWHETPDSELELEETETASHHCSCSERFRDLGNVAGEGTFTSQRLSGHEGEWVLYATPYMQ